MQIKIKHLITILALLGSTSILLSQNKISSVYSMFGVGDLNENNFGIHSSMGNSGSAFRSNQYINFKNPAAHSAIDSLSFIFTMGIKSKTNNIITSNNNYTHNNTNLDFLAIAFPVTKWLKSSIGLKPYSNIGYNISVTETDDNLGESLRYYYGNGGLNQFYFGNAIELFKNMSFGFNVNYLFGSLSQTKSLFFLESTSYLNTQREDKIRVSDFNLNYGIQYYNTFSDKLNYTVAINFENSNNVNSRYESLTASTVGSLYTYIKEEYINDTIQYINNANENLKFPTKIGAGLSLNYDNKLLINADYGFSKWSDAQLLVKQDTLINSNRFNFGLQYTPNKNSSYKYFKRVNYRVGGHIANSYIKINENQLKDIGITFGFGFPVKRSKSMADLSFQLGKRGTTDNNLILENYGIISLSVSLSDIWFVKRKFD